jgi:hypothetical protein
MFVELVFWSSVWTIGLTECLLVKVVLTLTFIRQHKTKSINV